MGKIYYNGIDYSTPVVSGVAGVKGNSESVYRTGNVNLTPANLGAAPISHAVTATTYGKGTATNYGHIKLSDTYTTSVGDASSGIAASQKALFDAYSELNNNIGINSNVLLYAGNTPEVIELHNFTSYSTICIGVSWGAVSHCTGFITIPTLLWDSNTEDELRIFCNNDCNQTNYATILYRGVEGEKFWFHYRTTNSAVVIYVVGIK